MTKPSTPVELLARVEELRLRGIAAEMAGNALGPEGAGKAAIRTLGEYLQEHGLSGIKEWSHLLVLAMAEDAGRIRFGRVLGKTELIDVCRAAMPQMPAGVWDEALDAVRGTQFQDPGAWQALGLGVLAAVVVVVASSGPEGEARKVYLQNPTLWTLVAIQKLVAPALAVLEPPAGRIM